MNLRAKRASHPGYIHTGGPPREQVPPGAKTEKEIAKEKREKKAKAKADGLKVIAAIERANTVAYANDETPRPTRGSSHARGYKKSNAQEPGDYQTVSPSEPAPELTSTGSDTENIHASGGYADEERPHESHVPPIEGSEPPTDLEHTIKKKSKGKPNVRKVIEDLKRGGEEEDPSPQETPVIVRTKRLRTEARPKRPVSAKKQKMLQEDEREQATIRPYDALSTEESENDGARKKPEEPKDHYRGRISQMGSEDENPLPVDVDSDSEVQKKGSKGVHRTNRIMSELDMDSDVAITKNVRKESRPRPIIISDKGKRQGDADACPSITRCQVGPTNIPMSSKPKLNTKKSDGGVPAAKATETDNISDQVPCGNLKRQVPHHVSNDARSQREGETKDKVVAGWVHATRQHGASSTTGSQSSRALTHRSKASKVSSYSVPSSRAVTRVTAGKYQISDDDTYANEVGGGAVSDNNEVEGVEGEEARNSPAKGKQRANNQGLVVIKRGKESKPSKRKRASNQTSLPSECHIGDMWAKQVIPTLIYWLGRQASPWYPVPELVLDALRITCQELYIPEVVDKIPLDRKEDEPYILVTQRFKDRWRNKIASSAQSILISFFESKPDLADSDDARAAYAGWALEGSRFCFAKARYDCPEKWRGLFYGELAILSFASHWECVRGFLNIEELQSDFEDGYSRGALALACSAVGYSSFYHPLANDHLGQMKCTLMLWKEGAITISAIQDARGTRCSIKLKARENKSTGKKTTGYAAFSGTHWKDDTKQFLKSVMTLSTEDMDAITNLAKTAAQRVTKVEGRASAMNVDDDDENEDNILRNGSASSEDEDEAAANIPRWKSHLTKATASASATPLDMHETQVRHQDKHWEDDYNEQYDYSLCSWCSEAHTYMHHRHNNLNAFSTRHQNSSSGTCHCSGNNVNPRPLQRNEEYIEFEGQTQADSDRDG